MALRRIKSMVLPSYLFDSPTHNDPPTRDFGIPCSRTTDDIETTLHTADVIENSHSLELRLASGATEGDSEMVWGRRTPKRRDDEMWVGESKR